MEKRKPIPWVKEFYYPISISTMNYLDTESGTQIFSLGLAEKELRKECSLRGIVADSIDDLYAELLKEIPDIHWQEMNVLWCEQYLDDGHRGELQSYLNYGYRSVNDRLRNGDSIEDYPLQQAFGAMPPLPWDIVCYRYSKNVKKYLNTEPGAVTTLKGFLSTSMMASFVFERIKEHKEIEVLKIHIPAGSQCIFVISSEYEILLPHGTKVEFLQTEEENVEGHKVYEVKCVA